MDENKLPRKTAIYIRVSTHWQVDKDSLQVQRRELTAYSEMILGIPDYEVFDDPGYSAKNTDRPAYQEMMNRLRTGEFSHLLVWKIDRISRNLLDFSNMYAELKELGVTFVSKNEQFDTSSAIGEAMLKIILVFAELERKMTAERVSSVMLSRANNGQWNGGRVPYGYIWNKETQKFSFDPVESAVYKRIVAMYEDNKPLLYITKKLNGEGLRTKSGNEWTPTAINKILRNPFYEGKYYYNTHAEGDRKKPKDKSEWIIIEDHHPALISEERFDAIQFRLRQNRRGGYKPGETRPKSNVHVFAGLFRCGVCGANMSATLDRRRADGWRPSIYGCATRRKSATMCTNKYISDVTAGPLIFGLLSNILKARKNGINDLSDSDLQKKILSGSQFYGMRIMDDDIQILRQMISAPSAGIQFKPAKAFSERKKDDGYDEQSVLMERKVKDENAVNRLKALYLYGKDEIPEKDFIIERKKILDDLEKVNKRLSEIEKQDHPLDEKGFIDKASYFLTVDYLLNEKKFDYEKYIRSVNPEIPYEFIHSVIDHVVIKDGGISSVTFKNEISIRFIGAE